MTNEFRAMLDRFVLVYLDDIFIYSRSLEGHLEHLRRVLETLRRTKYKANCDKCEFVRQELEYLGHFATAEGINPLSDKIQAIQEWLEPQNVTDVHSFLGLAGYYQRFIKGFSKIAAHLTKLQCEDRLFDFGEDALRGNHFWLSKPLYSTFEIGDDLRDSLIRGYQADPEFRDKYANCSSPNLVPSHYRIQEGYLLVHTRGKDLLCVPSDSHLRTRLLGEFHDAPASLLDDITRYCESCEVCQRCKSRNHRSYGELRPLPVPLRRREAIAMDINELFPNHKTGVDGILMVVDRLTKFAMFLPCRYHAKAPELTEVSSFGSSLTAAVPAKQEKGGRQRSQKRQRRRRRRRRRGGEINAMHTTGKGRHWRKCQSPCGNASTISMGIVMIFSFVFLCQLWFSALLVPLEDEDIIPTSPMENVLPEWRVNEQLEVENRASSDRVGATGALSGATNEAHAGATYPVTGGNLWKVWQRSECGRVFGNGFRHIRPSCGKHLRCRHNPEVETTICEARELAVDLQRITVSKGGEPIAAVLGQSEEEEMPRYRRGALAIPGHCNITVTNKTHFQYSLRDMMSSMVSSGQIAACDHWLEGTTLIVTRYEYANLYHTMTDWYNAYQAWRFAGVGPKNSSETHVVFFDGHSSGALDDGWEVLFGVKPVYVSQLPSRTCFRRAVFVPPGYTSALSITYYTTCGKSAHIVDFAKHLLTKISPLALHQNATGTNATVRILLIFRKNYVAHPRVGKKGVSRRIANEKGLLAILQRSFPDTQIRAVAMEELSFREQIRVIRDASIVIGVHGASLSYTLLMDPRSTLIELMPPEYRGRTHFAMFARYAGVRYVRVPVRRENKKGTHFVPPKVVVRAVRNVLSHH
ncbi:hypothetical protein CBR_g22021 [Chara braunii]|uniref:Reverse transcriptase domain-containing protein n=1 Tax=Chara braunii TaxID=69332 RepID=A0A388L247_CHABU|nr:hypothetical protein CBR_g22021 [Chara braunii]|eukprot:GBG76273.1 hypothetical protein CBR_g22021 [Chara braunii]